MESAKSAVYSYNGIIDRNLFASDRMYESLCLYQQYPILPRFNSFISDQEQNVNFRFKLIELSGWYGNIVDSEAFSNETRLQLPVMNVIVTHTRGDHCYKTKMCLNLIRSMIVSIINLHAIVIL